MFPQEHQKQIAEDIFLASMDSTFMKRIITGDKTWIYEYGCLNKTVSKQSGSLRIEI